VEDAQLSQFLGLVDDGRDGAAEMRGSWHWAFASEWFA
jgi:hypothetical protein